MLEVVSGVCPGCTAQQREGKPWALDGMGMRGRALGSSCARLSVKTKWDRSDSWLDQPVT